MVSRFQIQGKAEIGLEPDGEGRQRTAQGQRVGPCFHLQAVWRRHPSIDGRLKIVNTLTMGRKLHSQKVQQFHVQIAGALRH